MVWFAWRDYVVFVWTISRVFWLLGAKKRFCTQMMNHHEHVQMCHCVTMMCHDSPRKKLHGFPMGFRESFSFKALGDSFWIFGIWIGMVVYQRVFLNNCFYLRRCGSLRWKTPSGVPESLKKTTSVVHRTLGTRRGCPTSGPLDVFLFQFCMAINILWLVASNMAFIFHNIWDVILPIDIHIFQRGSNHQPVLFLHPGHWSPYVRISMVRSAAGCSDERCQRERLREWIGGATAEGGRHHGLWVLVMLSAYLQALIITSLNLSTDTYV